MMNIPFGNLQRQYQQFHEQFHVAMQTVCDRGWFVLGEEGHRFETSFAEYCSARYAIGVGSGTEALHLALVACGVQPGDEVITVANTCVPTTAAISFAGAIPVFVDVDVATLTMDPARIEERISSRTKVILPVHLYGQCADMTPIIELARRYNIAVVEDCAQAHGALYKGQMAGTFGDIGAFSFYPSKNLGAFGDAGAVVTNNEYFAQTIRKLRNYGEERRYYHSIKGFNSRLDEIQAAVLNAKLPYLNMWNQRRYAIAEKYSSAFSAIGLRCPQEAPGRKHNYHLYVLRVPRREQFQQMLKERGITTLIHYPRPVHLQEAYQEYQIQGRYLPVTERVANEIVSLPIYPELTNEEVDYLITTVIETLMNKPFCFSGI